MSFNPKSTISFLTRQAFFGMKNGINQKLRAAGHDFTMEQGGALMRLLMKDGQSQIELSEFLGKDKTTIARLINSMEKSLLVVRVPSKEDKRINLIYLTNKGKDAQKAVVSSLQETLKEALQGVDKKEEEIAKKVLQKMHDNLCSKSNCSE